MQVFYVIILLWNVVRVIKEKYSSGNQKNAIKGQRTDMENRQTQQQNIKKQNNMYNQSNKCKQETSKTVSMDQVG